MRLISSRMTKCQNMRDKVCEMLDRLRISVHTLSPALIVQLLMPQSSMGLLKGFQVSQTKPIATNSLHCFPDDKQELHSLLHRAVSRKEVWPEDYLFVRNSWASVVLHELGAMLGLIIFDTLFLEALGSISWPLSIKLNALPYVMLRYPGKKK